MGLFDFLKIGGSQKRKKPDPKTRIGEIEGYFRKVNAAVIKVKKGTLKKNDKIWIQGHTTDMQLIATSLEINRKSVESAKKGQSVGVEVKKRVRRGDGVYRIETN